MIEHEEPTQARQPPEYLTLIFCPKCGYDNRWRVLGPRHFARGRLCTGVVIELSYSLDQPKEERG